MIFLHFKSYTVLSIVDIYLSMIILLFGCSHDTISLTLRCTFSFGCERDHMFLSARYTARTDRLHSEVDTNCWLAKSGRGFIHTQSFHLPLSVISYTQVTYMAVVCGLYRQLFSRIAVQLPGKFNAQRNCFSWKETRAENMLR